MRRSSEYKEKYRGMVTFWKFDREKGRIDMPEVVRHRAAALLAGPVRRRQAGHATAGSSATRFNTEMATGGVEEGNPPFEAGVSQRDTDYLHIINWKKAAEVVAAGKAEEDQRHPRHPHLHDGGRRGHALLRRPSPRARTAST